MQRIASNDNLFHDGDLVNGVMGTIVTAAWLNALQEEVALALEAHGIALNPADNTQLRTLLQTKVNADKVDGYHASQLPGADAIPVIKSDSSLALPGNVSCSAATAASLTITTGNVTPQADSSRSVGTASLRFNTMYSVGGVLTTSDAREKSPVLPLSASEIAAAKELGAEIGSYRFLSAIAEKGEGARRHIGLTVQRAIEVMEAHALDPLAYGFICYDQWEDDFVDHPAELDEAGNEVKAAWREQVQAAGDRYGFREAQLALFIARGQAEALAGIEARLAALESR